VQSSGGSVAITTYQAGKVALAGWSGKEVSLLLRDFDWPMGLAVSDKQIALATRDEIICFSNAVPLAQHYPVTDPQGYDALYLPRAIHRTGNLRTHDVAFGAGEELWFANTLFSCLSLVSPHYSFVPRWQPRFISELVPEDRCHLNGLAMRDGRPAFCTALGTADTSSGWRSNLVDGGVVLDIVTGEIVARGLSMPHSPRWHDGKLWVLNSGTGELCMVDLARQTSVVVCAVPGFLRGLCFTGPYAVVGLCKIREKHQFSGLPVQSRFPRLQCGLAVIDLRSASHIATFEFTGGCHEVYDVQFLPGVSRPMLRAPRDQETHVAVTAPEFGYFLPAAEPAR
jgi:uncharacterized protein (TIGR03032 family)